MSGPLSPRTVAGPSDAPNQTVNPRDVYNGPTPEPRRTYIRCDPASSWNRWRARDQEVQRLDADTAALAHQFDVNQARRWEPAYFRPARREKREYRPHLGPVRGRKIEKTAPQKYRRHYIDQKLPRSDDQQPVTNDTPEDEGRKDSGMDLKHMFQGAVHAAGGVFDIPNKKRHPQEEDSDEGDTTEDDGLSALRRFKKKSKGKLRRISKGSAERVDYIARATKRITKRRPDGSYAEISPDDCPKDA